MSNKKAPAKKTPAKKNAPKARKQPKELWRVGGFGDYVCASVVADKGVVYVVRTGAKSGGSALAIKAGLTLMAI